MPIIEKLDQSIYQERQKALIDLIKKNHPTADNGVILCIWRF